MWLNIETLVWKRAHQVPHVTMLQIAPSEVETGEVDGAEVRARLAEKPPATPSPFSGPRQATGVQYGNQRDFFIVYGSRGEVRAHDTVR